jgi:hypothetical protein
VKNGGKKTQNTIVAKMLSQTPKRRKIVAEFGQPVNRTQFMERCETQLIFADARLKKGAGVLRSNFYQEILNKCQQARAYRNKLAQIGSSYRASHPVLWWLEPI